MAESILDRFGRIATTLRQVVNRGRALGVTDFVILRIQAQIGRIASLLPQALARIDWPTRRRPPRPYIPREPKPLAHPMDGWRRIRLRRREGWLIRLMPGVAHRQASYLQILLAEPEMATLAATPRGRRLLRPLCRMLGITSSLPEPAPPDAPPGFVATPSPVALAAKPPPPPPPVTDTWQTCAMPSQPISHIWPPYKILPTR